MALTFVTGPAGAGKTEWMYKKILETAGQDRKKLVLVIVPEQFSLQTMQDILMKSETKSMLNIEVLSFMRLSYRVFDELGVTTGQLLSDLGKSLLLKRVLNQNAKELRIFAANIKKPGFLDELKSLLSEFYQYGITPETIRELAGKQEDNPVLARKMADIALLFQGFEDAISGKYLPAETVSDVLAGVLEGSQLLSGCTIFLDGFTGFTPSQYGLLKQLFCKAGKCYMTLTMEQGSEEAPNAEHGLFYFTRRTMEIVKRLADEVQCPTDRIFLPEDGILWRFRDAQPLLALQEGIFRYPVPKKVSCGSAIELHEQKNRREEAAFIASDLKQKVQTKGLRYGRFAVITGDVEGYADVLCEEFEAAGIPYFLDSKRNVFHNPCIAFLRAVLQNALYPFSYDSVFRYLKNALSDYSEDEVSELENYCLGCGIHGERAWKREWHYRYRTGRELSLTELNRLRQAVYGELSEITKTLQKEPTAGGKTRGLYAFLEQAGIEEKLLAQAAELEEKGDAARAGEYRQVYNSVISLFDSMMELLDTEEISLREFAELCEAGFLECKIGLIPSGNDAVFIGDLMRTRLPEIDVLYLAGVNEGVTPAPAGGGGLISEAERETLKEQKVELAPGRKEAAYTEQFYLYFVLTKPRRGLILTYSRLSMDGAALLPSWFLRRIGELFTDFGEKDTAASLERYLKNDNGKKYLLDGIREFAASEFAAIAASAANERERDGVFWELYRQAMLHDEEMTKRLLRTAFFESGVARISPETARRLYGALLYGSVTRMEKYAACAFAHFVRYGLDLEERAEYRAAAPEMGTLYHTALELFSKKVHDAGMTWHALTDDVQERLCDESVEEAAEQAQNGVFSGTKRNGYLLVRAKRILQKAVTALREQIAGSLFEPEHCEAVFEHTSKYMSLHGKIDRYDLCENEGKWFLRVIDYKSGRKEFDLSELYYGLQVQLEVYLAAAKRLAKKEHGEEPEVAGLFYFTLADPFIDREKFSEETVLSEARPNGLINPAPSAITALDCGFRREDGGLRPGYASLLIRAETDQEGNLKARTKTADTGFFDEMTEYVYRKLEKEAKEIYAGEISVNPYRYKKETACTFCAYRSVCGFDGRLRGYSYRNLKELEKEEFAKRLREEGESEGQKEG